MPLALLVFCLVFLLLVLRLVFPDAVVTTDEALRITYLVLMLLLIGGMSGMVRRTPRKKQMEFALLWFAIVVALMMGYRIYTRNHLW